MFSLGPVVPAWTTTQNHVSQVLEKLNYWLYSMHMPYFLALIFLRFTTFACLFIYFLSAVTPWIGDIIQSQGFKCSVYLDNSTFTSSDKTSRSESRLIYPTPYSAYAHGYLKYLSNLTCPKLNSCSFSVKVIYSLSLFSYRQLHPCRLSVPKLWNHHWLLSSLIPISSPLASCGSPLKIFSESPQSLAPPHHYPGPWTNFPAWI